MGSKKRPLLTPFQVARASFIIFVCWQAVAIDLMMSITGLSSTRSLMTISAKSLTQVMDTRSSSRLAWSGFPMISKQRIKKGMNWWSNKILFERLINCANEER